MRLRFEGWLVNSRLVTSPCIILKPGDVLEPFYDREFLVTVNSKPQGLFTFKSWYKGGTINIEVPRVITLKDSKYILEYSDNGILRNSTSPDKAVLELAVSSPLSVTLYYKAVYKVVIILEHYNLDNIEFWAEEGRIKVVDVPSEIQISDKVKLILSGISAANADVKLLTPRGTLEVKARGPAEVYPLYTKYYLVRYETAAGTTEKWVPEGGQITINAMASQQENAGSQRLIFKQWEGDIESLSPVLTVTVERPLELRAVYQIEWKVTVDSLIGTREYWVPDGGTQIIFVPPELPGVLIGRQLDFYLVNGQKVEPGPGGFIKVGPVKEPVQVVAVYKSVILWNNVAILAGLLIGVVLIYIAYDLFASGRDEEEEHEEGEPEVREPEDRGVDKEEPGDVSVGPWAS
ncbi:MAG: hypothetical protein GSR78_01215 [Desulfurococcales archaeon]|nr:hypothetical protein [Desulfurococcales archaeon]